MYRLVGNFIRWSKQNQVASKIHKRLSSNSSKSAETNIKLPQVLAFATGTTIGFISGYNKNFFAALFSKLGVYVETVESYLADPHTERSEHPDVHKYLKLCEAIMKIAGKAILTTVNHVESQEGEWCSIAKCRAVGPFTPEPGLQQVFFLTNKLSRKYQQIQKNPHIVLSYLDHEGIGYVAIEGKAEILSDEDSTEHWTHLFGIFFPEGPVSNETPDSRFVVVKVVPERLEFWSVRFGIETGHQHWLPPAMIRDPKDGAWKMCPMTKIAEKPRF